METVTTILGGGIRDLLERHPVVPKQYPRIVREVGAGITELLRRQNGERVSFSLSPEEVISLVPRVLGRLSADPDLRKSLETTGNKPLSDDDSSLTRFWPVFRETPPDHSENGNASRRRTSSSRIRAFPAGVPPSNRPEEMGSPTLNRIG